MLSASLVAQQIPLYSQHTFNRYSFNPAFSGLRNRAENLLTHRNHLLNFPGAPTTQQLTVTIPWQVKYMGFGMRVFNDNIGISNNFGLNFSSNYYITIGEGRLSMGVELGIVQHSLDWASLEIYDVGDIIIPAGRARTLKPNGAFGLFYTTEKWYAGYSVQNLVASRFSSGPEDIAYRNHHFINAGGAIPIGKLFQIEPHTLIKAVSGSPWQMDIGTYFVYQQKYGIGAAYRTGDALVFTLKIELLDQFYFGYNYETRTNTLKPYSNSSHEFMLGYYINLLEPARTKIIHPRYYF
jgi:type IX secretion system PorP/SprF family membrane protein